jgi:hypothetical protein
MRRLYILLASAVMATLIAVATGVASAGDPFLDDATAGQEYGALAIAPSLLKVPGQAPNNASPEAAWRTDTNLTDAKKLALSNCENQGIANERYYKDDCQGAVWVRNGWVALATEQLAPKGTTVPYRYKYAYGGAYGETRNQAIGKAIDNCYKKDPQYEQCVFVDAVPTYQPFKPNAHGGGAW